MPGTDDPTPEEVFANLQYNVGRISAAQREIVRRLKAAMPAAIDYLNEQLEYPEGKGIPQPQNYLAAPSTAVLDDYANCILVSVAVSTSPNGVGTFKHEAQVVVYSIDRRIEHPTQVQDAFDRSAIAIGVLLKFLNGCEDDEGRRYWRVLAPTGHTLALPGAWGQAYSGSTAYFTLVQDQSCNCWV